MTELGADQQSATPRGRSSRLWKWTKRVSIGLTGSVLLLLLAGVVYQFLATKNDERKYPAPGEMVDVGGYSLHLNCTGEEVTPTVVMDSGLGSTVGLAAGSAGGCEIHARMHLRPRWHGLERPGRSTTHEPADR